MAKVTVNNDEADQVLLMFSPLITISRILGFIPSASQSSKSTVRKFIKLGSSSLYSVFLTSVMVYLFLRWLPLGKSNFTMLDGVSGIQLSSLIIPYLICSVLGLYHEIVFRKIARKMLKLQKTSWDSEAIIRNTNRFIRFELFVGLLWIVFSYVAESLDWELDITFISCIVSDFTIFTVECYFTSWIFLTRQHFYDINLKMKSLINYMKFCEGVNSSSRAISHPEERDSRGCFLLQREDYVDFVQTAKVHVTCLYKITRRINSLYSLPLLMSIAANFVIITCRLYHCLSIFFGLSDEDIEKVSVRSSVTWITFYSAKMLWIITTCSKLRGEVTRTPLLIHKLRCRINNENAREELHMFSLELLHSKLELTAGGLFPLDYTLIYSIVGAVTTYLIILIQFQLSYKQEQNIMNCTLKL